MQNQEPIVSDATEKSCNLCTAKVYKHHCEICKTTDQKVWFIADFNRSKMICSSCHNKI